MGKSLSEIFLVMDYADHELRHLLQSSRYNLSVSEIKCLLKQLLEAVSYMHSKDIVHRDLKTSNLLYTSEGVLKVCDFGLSRKMNGSEALTPTVVTLTYRAPELLLGCEKYTSAIDMWAIGCIFAELLLGEPLFKGRNEIEQIDSIFRTMGTPSTSSWPDWKQYKLAGLFENMKKNNGDDEFYSLFAGLSFNGGVYVSDDGIDLLEQLLTYNPEKRITASNALKHPWFQEQPLPCGIKEMPVFENGTNEVERNNNFEVITKKLFTINNKFSEKIIHN